MFKNTTFKLLLVSSLFLSLFSFSNCKKDDADTKGDIVATAFGLDNSRLVGELVELYDNAAKTTVKQEKTTDSNGQVKFTDLEPGIYYLECTYETDAFGERTLEAEVSVFAGKETSVNLD